MGFPHGIFGGGAGLGSGNIVIGAETRMMRQQVRQGINGVKQEMQAGAADIERSGRRASAAWGAVGTALKVGFLGVVGAVAAGIGAAVQFESAWAGVRKTVEATPKELEALRQQFRDLAKEIPVSVNELAKIGETAGALGIAKENILEFTKTVALIGQTTNVSTDAAATALGGLTNVLHLTEKDYGRFASTLVDLGNKGASTESQILEIASRAGAAAGLLHIGAKDVLAYASSIASLRIEAEAGGTSLQTFFMKANSLVGAGSALADVAKKVHVGVSDIERAVAAGGKSLKTMADNTGLTTKKLKELVVSKDGLEIMAHTAGMTASAFAKAFEKDAPHALAAFLEGLGKLKGSDQQGILKDLKLGDVRMLRTLLGLANGGDLLAKNLNNAAAAWDANTAAAAEAEKRFETFASQLGLLKNLLQDYLISLGDMALPALKAFVTFLREGLPKAITFLADIWNRILLPPLRTVGDAFGHLVDVIGRAFSDSKGPTDWGKAAGTALSGVASAAAQVAKYVGIMVEGVAWLLDNPLGQWAVRILAAAAALKLLLGMGGSLVGMLRGASGSLLRSIPGIGRLLPTDVAKTPEGAAAKALEGSAGKLSGSAAALEGAATALKTGGKFNTAGQFGFPGKPGNQGGPIAFAPDPFAQTGGVGHLPGMARPGPIYVANDAATKAYMLRNGRAFEAAGRGAVRQAIAGTLDAVGAGARGAASLATSVGRGIVGLGSFATKLFWPAMVAGIGTELIKAPIGEFIANNTKFKRVGALMKEDFFGGLINLVKSWHIGSDLFTTVPELRLGPVTLKTANLGNAEHPFDLTPEQEAALGKEGIEGLQGAQAITPAALKALQQLAGETAVAWLARVRESLVANGIDPAKFDALIKREANPTHDRFGGRAITPESMHELETALSSTVAGLGSKAVSGVRTAINDSVIAGIRQLTGGRLTLTQMLNLPSTTYDKLADLLVLDAHGMLDPKLLALSLSGAMDKPTPGKPTPATYWGFGGRAMREDPSARLKVDLDTSRASITEANTKLAEWIGKLTPDERGARNLGLQVMDYIGRGVTDAGKDKGKRTKFLAEVNKALGLTGQAKMSWVELIDWRASLSESTGTTAQKDINERFKKYAVAAAAAGATDGASMFLARWGKEIAAAKTPAQEEVLRKKLNDLIPATASNLDKDKFAAWMKSVQSGDFSKEVLRKKLNDLIPGTASDMTKAAFKAWMKDVQSGKFPEGELLQKLNDLIPGQANDIQKGKLRQWLADLTKSAAGDTGTESAVGKLQALETKAAAAIKQFYDDIPLDVQRDLDAFVAKTRTVSPLIVAKLTEKFGSDWATAFRDGTSKITNKPVDKAVVNEMVRVFGPRWRDALQTFGKLLFLREGGADTLAMKKALAAAITKTIVGLTPGDLTPDPVKGHKKPKPPTGAETKQTEQDISKYITSAVGKAALEAAAGADAQASKKGMEDLGTALKNLIPSAAKRDIFISTLVGLQKATQLPLGGLRDFISSAVPKAADFISTMAAGVDVLIGKAREFIALVSGTKLPSPQPFIHPTKPDPKPPKPGGPNPQPKPVPKPVKFDKSGIPAARGIVFDTTSETTMTVGEAGSEHVAVLRSPRRIPLPRAANRVLAAGAEVVRQAQRTGRHALTMPSLAFATAGAPALNGTRAPAAAPSGSRGDQHIRVDHMHLENASDERAVLETLEFLAPGGLA